MTAKSFAIASKLVRVTGNWFVARILRSPFHSLLSRTTLLISFTGCHSGKTFSLPVNYARDGEALVIVSQADRRWWRNLRGGAPVSVRTEGKRLTGYGESFEAPTAVAAGLLSLLQQIPAFRKHAGVALTPVGQPEHPDDLARLAQGRVVVRITDLVAEPVLEL